MDLYEMLVSAIVIAAAIWFSGWLLDAMLPPIDYVDRTSPGVKQFEERNQRLSR